MFSWGCLPQKANLNESEEFAPGQAGTQITKESQTGLGQGSPRSQLLGIDSHHVGRLGTQPSGCSKLDH